MVENFIVIQLTFAEIFVAQDFTIRTTPRLSGPTNTCGFRLYHLKVNSLFVLKVGTQI